MQDIANAFNWLAQYIHVGGWFFLIFSAWKISWKFSRFLTNLLESIDKGKDAAEITTEMNKTVELVATNHLPHLQEAMNNVLAEIKGLRTDLLQVLLRK